MLWQVVYSGTPPKKVEAKLFGTAGVTLKITLKAMAYKVPEMENVVIEACYESGKATMVRLTCMFVRITKLRS